MKTVDGKYSYDEMEGFEPFDVAGGKQLKSVSLLTVKNGCIFLNKCAMNIVAGKKYMHIFLNTERKRLMIQASNDYTSNALQVPNYIKNGVGVGCAKICRKVEEICKYDTNIAAVKFVGEPAKTKRDALIFDLTKFTTAQLAHKH
jgi:hypothetical protein